MKVLTMCYRGAVRSVATAMFLREERGHDAIPIPSLRRLISDATVSMLARWADVIVVVDRRFAARVPRTHRRKVTVWPIPDAFVTSLDPRLRTLAARYADAHGM